MNAQGALAYGILGSVVGKHEHRCATSHRARRSGVTAPDGVAEDEVRETCYQAYAGGAGPIASSTHLTVGRTAPCDAPAQPDARRWLVDRLGCAWLRCSLRSNAGTNSS